MTVPVLGYLLVMFTVIVVLVVWRAIYPQSRHRACMNQVNRPHLELVVNKPDTFGEQNEETIDWHWFVSRVFRRAG